jgi:FkbM family methyltransferase
MDYTAQTFAKFGTVQIVDIGANTLGGKPPYQPMIDREMCHLIGFEPQKEPYQELVALNHPNATYVNAAIGDGKTHALYCYEATGLTSFFPLRQESIDTLQYGGHELVSKETLTTVKLDSVSEIQSIDYLKIDTQGSELMILRGGARKIAKALAVHIELRMLPLYVGEPAVGDVMKWLSTKRFEFHNFVGMNRFPMNGTRHAGFSRSQRQQIGDADGLFFRDLTRLNTLKSDEIGRQACIAATLQQTNYLMFCVNELVARDELTNAEREKIRLLIVD